MEDFSYTLSNTLYNIQAGSEMELESKNLGVRRLGDEGVGPDGVSHGLGLVT